jgi:hypothetical protein
VGATYFAMASTNLNLPVWQWTPVYTNIFGSGGSFVFTNKPVVLTGQRYFAILVP